MANDEKFWWEEGYKLQSPNDSGSSSGTPHRCKHQEILYGEAFLKDTIKDTSNTLMCIISEDGELLITLIDAGKALGSTVDVYQISTQPPVLLRTIVVDEKCGYLALSSCQSLLAVGMLKEDKTLIIDFQTGELLVNLNGGCKSGYFGSLHFSKENRNIFFEQRITRQTSAGPQQSVYRLWDLGFKETTGCGDEEDEDEVETKLWEHSLRGSLTMNVASSSSSSSSSSSGATAAVAALTPLVYMTHEQSKQLQSIDFSTGKVSKVLKFGRWTSKGVLSTHNKHMMAVAHFGDVSIIDLLGSTGFEIIKTIQSPIADDKYPLVPLSFIYDRGYEFLVCRINYDRTLIIYSVQDPSMYIMVKNLGGTISDSTVITPDGKKLICWPFGCIEIYDLQSMVNHVTKRISIANKWQILYLREMFRLGRCKVINSQDNGQQEINCNADQSTAFRTSSPSSLSSSSRHLLNTSAIVQKIVQLDGHQNILTSIFQYF